MPKVNEMKPSKFLKQEDVGDEPVLVTIKAVKQHNVARDDQEPDNRWCVEFKEYEKPMTLNWTNMQVLEKALGSDDSDDWIGKQVVLFVDENVQYKGEIVGGLRFRAPKKPAGKKPQAQAAVAAEVFEDDDTPF